jgi:hypothetical protein
MKSASSTHATAAASADSAASAKPGRKRKTRTSPNPSPRWRKPVLLLLTFGLCLGAGLLIKREQQRQAALSLLEDCGATCMAWHGPWGREHILDKPDWDELRSRAFLYPDVIVTSQQRRGLAGEPESTWDSGENEDTDNTEKVQMLKELHKSDPLKLLAALEVLQPKMLIMRWNEPQSPGFWHRLSQITSLKGLMVRSWINNVNRSELLTVARSEGYTLPPWSGGFDHRALHEVTRLPHLSVLMVTSSLITDADLTCLESCPQLQTLSLEHTRVTQQGALACMRRCPNLQIKLNGQGVSRR